MRDRSGLEPKYLELYKILVEDVGKDYADLLSDDDIRSYARFLKALLHGCIPK